MKKELLLSILVGMTISACEENNTSYGSTYEEIKNEIIDEGNMGVSEECIEAARITKEMEERARQYRSCTHRENVGTNGVYVYSQSVEKYKTAPEQLAARIKVLGFADVYLSPKKALIASADPWVRTFISTLRKYGINTHAIRITDNKLYVNEAKVSEEVALITKYNDSVLPEERFYGIAADLEPHTCKGKNKPQELSYEWDSQTGYGIGGPNDKLLQLTLERLQKADDLLPEQLQLNEAVHYNYQIKVDENELSYGTIPQFLKSCDWVIIMAYSSNKESIWNKSEPSLKAASAVKERTKTVSICVKTAINDKDSEGLQSKKWKYLLETAEYILDKGKSYASFRGFDIFTYEGLEAMWEKEE